MRADPLIKTALNDAIRKNSREEVEKLLKWEKDMHSHLFLALKKGNAFMFASLLNEVDVSCTALLEAIYEVRDRKDGEPNENDLKIIRALLERELKMPNTLGLYNMSGNNLNICRNFIKSSSLPDIEALFEEYGVLDEPESQQNPDTDLDPRLDIG